MAGVGHVHDGDYWALAIELVTELAEIVRGVVNSATAGTVTEDAGMDMGHAVFELLAIYYNFELDHILVDAAPATGAGWVLSKVWVKRCFSIVFWLLVLFTALEYLNGVAEPDEGKDFIEGRHHFEGISATLLKAKAGEWSGEGAKAYNEKNEKLYGLVEIMGDADRQIATIVRRQAEQVQNLREELASILGSLVVLLLAIALYMKFSGSLAPGECVDSECVTAACVDKRTQEFFSSRGMQGNVCWVPGQEVQNATDVIDSAAATVNSASPTSATAPANWLPPLVAGVAIVATTVAIVFIALIFDSAKSNADDIDKEKKRYRQAAQDAAEIARGAGIGASRRSVAALSAGAGLGPLRPLADYGSPDRAASRAVVRSDLRLPPIVVPGLAVGLAGSRERKQTPERKRRQEPIKPWADGVLRNPVSKQIVPAGGTVESNGLWASNFDPVPGSRSVDEAWREILVADS